MRFELLHGIRREASFSEMITDLRGASESSDFKAFRTIKDVLSFAAFFAFEKGILPIQLSGALEDVSTREYLNDEENLKAIHLLALVVKNDVEILKRDNQLEMIQIFESYANAGLKEIEKYYLASGGFVFSTIKLIAHELFELEMPSTDSIITEKPRIF